MTEDAEIFGKDMWVYCNQHLRPHLTGWCTVPVANKVGLGIKNEDGSSKKAFSKCEQFNLEIYDIRKEKKSYVENTKFYEPILPTWKIKEEKGCGCGELGGCGLCQ